MFSWRGLMTLRHRKFSFSTPSNKFQINLHFVPVLWEKAWLNVWLRWLNEMVERLVEQLVEMVEMVKRVIQSSAIGVVNTDLMIE